MEMKNFNTLQELDPALAIAAIEKAADEQGRVHSFIETALVGCDITVETAKRYIQENGARAAARGSFHFILGHQLALIDKFDQVVFLEVVLADYDLAPLHSEEELALMSEGFAEEVIFYSLSLDSDVASAVDAAKQLAQHSSSTHSVIIPDGAEAKKCEDGDGAWVPALVYVPNRFIGQN